VSSSPSVLASPVDSEPPEPLPDEKPSDADPDDGLHSGEVQEPDAPAATPKASTTVISSVESPAESAETSAGEFLDQVDGGRIINREMPTASQHFVLMVVTH
jgi:hypothetical protein